MKKCAAVLVVMALVAPAAAQAPAPDPAPAPAVGSAPPPAVAEPPEDPEEPFSDDGNLEVISVSGSSVEHDLITGRAPVSVVTRAQLESAGRSTLGDVLQTLPAQANGGNAQANGASGDGTTRINLRGLGVARTLVLINGRRIVNGGNGADASVDVNAIPIAMIERVEVYKDGASTQYGAEAIGGVVNIVTRPRFNGVDVSLLTSTSQHGDGTDYDASTVLGFSSHDKHTYVVMSAGFQRHDPVFAADRSFANTTKAYDFASRTERRFGSLTTPNGRFDLRAVGPGQTAVVPPGCTTGLCSSDGNRGFTDFSDAGDRYNDTLGNYLYTPSQRFNVFATGGNRFTESTAVTAQLLYQQRASSRRLTPVGLEADVPVSKDSLYNPFGADLFDIRRRITELGPRRYRDEAKMFHGVVSFTGEVPADLPLAGWRYEISANYGDFSTKVSRLGQLLFPRVADALGPSMYNDKGVPICVKKPGDPTTQIVYVIRLPNGLTKTIPCAPLNIFDSPGAIPKHQWENLTYDDTGQGTNTLKAYHAGASGKLGTWANHGEASLSVGADYRTENGYEVPPTVAVVGYTSEPPALPTDGTFRILEGYADAVAVAYAGDGVIRRVELDAGAHALRHSDFGSSLTWKTNGLVRAAGGVALRGTYATAFRAPSVRDTFGGIVQQDITAEDPCDAAPPSAGNDGRTLAPEVQARCTAQGVPVDSRFNSNLVRAANGGDPDLRAETAVRASAGIVYEPPQLPGLAISADYWHTSIDHAIETLAVSTILANCYERELDEFCDQIHRDDVTHRIIGVDQLLQNVRRTVTSGFDLAVRDDRHLGELGDVQTMLEGQYLVRYDLATARGPIHGVGNYDLGVFPRLKANLTSMWNHKSGASGGFNLRYIGGYRECAGNDCDTAAKRADAHDVDQYFKLDVFGGYDFRWRYGKGAMQIGINNVLDATPPVVYNAPQANSDAATYDFVGRVAFVRISQQF